MARNDYQVAVITHRRPQACAANTLRVLRQGGIPRDRVTVFVSDPNDVTTYRRYNPGWNIQPGAIGLAANRNHVSRHYPAGQPLVCCDDDIQAILRLHNTTGKLVPETHLHELFRNAFTEMAQHGATLWGTSPTSNHFYMSNKTSTGLKFCIGVLHGIINRPNETLTCHCKDDYERTLLRWETDGTVIRLDNVTAVHAYDANPGGLEAYNGRTAAKAQADVDYLMRRWPGLVHPNTRRKSPYPEILLRAPRKETL